MAALDIEQIVRLQRNEHGAAAAFVDEVEAVIEELAEQREPRVERRRQGIIDSLLLRSLPSGIARIGLDQRAHRLSLGAGKTSGRVVSGARRN